jgi:hypothetical protein
MGVHQSIDSAIILLTAVLVPNNIGDLWGATARTPALASLHYSDEVKKKFK